MFASTGVRNNAHNENSGGSFAGADGNFSTTAADVRMRMSNK